jgi:hypothetical protein
MFEAASKWSPFVVFGLDPPHSWLAANIDKAFSYHNVRGKTNRDGMEVAIII